MLIKSKAKNAFNANVATEVDAGKPIDQAVAIAYSVKKDATKKKKVKNDRTTKSRN